MARRVEARLALRDERGFTLVELINVLLILAILMSISVSAYTTLHAKAEQRAALANVRAVLPAVGAWRNDNPSYAGMTMALLNSLYLDSSVDITYYDVGPTLDVTNWCIQYTSPSGDYIAKAQGPVGTLSVGPGNACV
jgi:prepilin-type N-terminal cleavage/methylation domain-containing protein